MATETGLLPADLRVSGGGPVEYLPARGEVYPDRPELHGLDLLKAPSTVSAAYDYMRQLYPDTELETINLHSGTAVVLGDAEGRAYKLFHRPTRYAANEREAAAVWRLHELGLAPQPYLFVDAASAYRYEQSSRTLLDTSFRDVSILRQDGGLSLPVLIMERIQTAPVHTLDPETFAAEFCRVAKVLIEHEITIFDIEPVVDRRTGGMVILDAGRVGEYGRNHYSDPEKSQMKCALEILHLLGMYTLPISDSCMTGMRIDRAYREGGMDEVERVILNMRGREKAQRFRCI